MKFINFIFLMLLLCKSAFSQSKKEQIVTLIFQKDSLGLVLERERQLNSDQVKQLETKISKINSDLALIQKELAQSKKELADSKRELAEKEEEIEGFMVGQVLREDTIRSLREELHQIKSSKFETFLPYFISQALVGNGFEYFVDGEKIGYGVFDNPGSWCGGEIMSFTLADKLAFEQAQQARELINTKASQLATTQATFLITQQVNAGQILASQAPQAIADLVPQIIADALTAQIDSLSQDDNLNAELEKFFLLDGANDLEAINYFGDDIVLRQISNLPYFPNQLSDGFCGDPSTPDGIYFQEVPSLPAGVIGFDDQNGFPIYSTSPTNLKNLKKIRAEIQFEGRIIKIYYFVELNKRWYLVVVDNCDCSA